MQRRLATVDPRDPRGSPSSGGRPPVGGLRGQQGGSKGAVEGLVDGDTGGDGGDGSTDTPTRGIPRPLERDELALVVVLVTLVPQRLGEPGRGTAAAAAAVEGVEYGGPD